jgi:D-threo-aldose 1-dehydrogenase
MLVSSSRYGSLHCREDASVTIQTKLLGRTGLPVTVLGFGGTALGNMYAAVSEREAGATLDAAYAAGVRYFDTAPLYGHGLSELRTGSGLRAFADPGVIVSTKVGWRLKPAFGQPAGAGLFEHIAAFSRFNDYSYDGVMRSFEDSLNRLGTDRVDILLIHDADRRNQGERYPEVFRAAMDGAYQALVELREQRLVKAIGCGLNEWESCQDFAEAGDFDCFLLAGRYTLLEQDSLDEFLPWRGARHRHRGRALQLRHPGGGAVKDAWFHYAPAPGADASRRHQAVCLASGAAQGGRAAVPLHHPCVATVIPGMRSPRVPGLSHLRARFHRPMARLKRPG